MTSSKAVAVALVLLVACSMVAGSASAGVSDRASVSAAREQASPKPPPPPKTPPTAPADPRAAGQQQPGVNPVGAATKAFLDRMQQYVDFHNNVEKTVPPLNETADPAKISAREKALGEALIKTRPDAKQGDFFIKEYQPILIKIIHEDFAKRSLADRKALIVELPKGMKVGVNTVYPTTIPLATFPANLLKAVPELPPELEYRIVGRDLILRDVKGNVVVDIMPGIFPIPTS